MNRDSANRVALLAAGLVLVGSLLSGLLEFLLMMASVESLPRAYVFRDPIGWALRPRTVPLQVVAMLVAVVVLSGLVWLFVRLVARAAAPGRAAALFFGSWAAIIVAGLVSGAVRTPILLPTYGFPPDIDQQIIMSTVYNSVTAAPTWALWWGWIAAAVAALVHVASTRRMAAVAPVGAPYSPQQQYPPQQQQYPPYPPQP